MSLKDWLKKIFGGSQKKIVVDEIVLVTAAVVKKAIKEINKLDPTISEVAALNLIVIELQK